MFYIDFHCQIALKKPFEFNWFCNRVGLKTDLRVDKVGHLNFLSSL